MKKLIVALSPLKIKLRCTELLTNNWWVYYESRGDLRPFLRFLLVVLKTEDPRPLGWLSILSVLNLLLDILPFTSKTPTTTTIRSHSTIHRHMNKNYKFSYYHLYQNSFGLFTSFHVLSLTIKRELSFWPSIIRLHW